MPSPSHTFTGTISPVGAGVPGQPPDHIWGGANEPFPTPPIYFPVQPPGCKPPDGGEPPTIWVPVFPTNPIVIPPTEDLPIYIWGGGNVPMPNPPIYIPIVPVQPPLQIWGPDDPRPTPPIYIPIEPPVGAIPPTAEHPIYYPVHIWGGGNVPMPTPPIYLPPEGGTPEPPTDAHPEHPIYYPPEIWVPVFPDNLPVFPPEGGYVPVFPAHPIVLPPEIWGPTDPRPTPPIYIPSEPEHPPSEEQGGKWVYVPGKGWLWQPTGSGDKPHPPNLGGGGERKKK